MSSFFAIYRGWVQHAATQSTAGHSEEALPWDFPAQPSGRGLVDQAARTDSAALQRPVAAPRAWTAPL